MVEVNAKFIVALVVAAVLIGAGFSVFHETYNAQPYTEIKLPKIFLNEKQMLAFSRDGSSFSLLNRSNILLNGHVTLSSGANYNGEIYIFDFPWVVPVKVQNGYYEVTLLHFGSYTIGYKASGYHRAFTKFSILSGSSITENVAIQTEGSYQVNGDTQNITKSPVQNVNLTFVSFFGVFNTTSNGKGKFSTKLQNGTYLSITIKRNYNLTPKPKFFNVSAGNLNNLVLTMKRTSNATYPVSGRVQNDLGIPLAGVKVFDAGQNTTKTSSKNLSSNYVLTNNLGLYTICVPAGINVLGFVHNGYIAAHSQPIDVFRNISNVNQNLTVIDPFVQLGINANNTGLKFLPTFMDSQVNSRITGNNSIPLFASYNPLSSLSLSLNNKFYSPNKVNEGSFLPNFTTVIVGSFNGTIYHTSVTTNALGLAKLPVLFSGVYNLAVYVPGFNWLPYNVTTQTNLISAVYSVYLEPLPGQYFQFSGNTLNGVDLAVLAYPNITLLENGLVVNASLENSPTGSFSFKYFVDTSQIYSIKLGISVQQVGFQNQTISKVVASTSPSNLVGIVLKANPVFSIGQGFNETSKPTPGLDQKNLSQFANAISSDKFNKGNESISLSEVVNQTLPIQNYVVLSQVNGVIYSKVLNNFGKNAFVNTTFSTNFNLTTVNQYYLDKNVNSSNSRKQSMIIHAKERNLKYDFLNLTDLLYQKADSLYSTSYGVNLNVSPSASALVNSNSAYSVNYHSSKALRNDAQVEFLLSNGIYNFTYNSNGFIANSTSIYNNVGRNSFSMNLSQYGVLTLIKSNVNFDYTNTLKSKTISTVNYTLGGLQKYNTTTSKNYSMNTPGIISGYYINTVLSVDRVTFYSNSSTVTSSEPMDTQFLNISSTTISSILEQTPYQQNPTKYQLYNNSINLKGLSGFITNMTIYSGSSKGFVNGFNLSTGTIGYLNNKVLFKTESAGDSNLTNNLKFIAGNNYKVDINLGQVQTNLASNGEYLMYMGVVSVVLNQKVGGE